MSTPEDAYKKSERGAWVSIGAYVLLTATKLGVGWWSGSRALVADGVNNLTDIIGSVTVLLGLRIAVRPADEDHRYGHYQAETVAAMVVASIMGLIGLNIFFNAVTAVFRTELEAPHPLSLWVALASAVIMIGVYQFNIRLSRATGSQALAAAAYDNRSDAITSIGAAAGIFGAQMGWRWMDPLAGVLVAAIIIRTAWHIGADAAHSLTGGFDADTLGLIRRRAAGVQGVVRINDVKARKLGQVVAVDITVGLQSTLTLVEAHSVTDKVEAELLGFLDIGQVHVHAEPAGPGRKEAISQS